MSKIRILLVEDHAILRESLQLLIRGHVDFEVISEATTYPQALDKALEHKPNLISLDLSLPGGSGIRFIEEIRMAKLTSRIVVLTMHDDPSIVRGALAAGCDGYILKSSTSSTLIRAFRSVYNGERFIDPALGTAFYGREQIDNNLTEREREILRLLAMGVSYAKIAESLFVSVKTIEAHRTRMAKKLNFQSRADLVRYALELGILSSTEIEGA